MELTPKEKAEDLVKKMNRSFDKYSAKQCALIAVDEIIISILQWGSETSKSIEFYQQVRNEINNL